MTSKVTPHAAELSELVRRYFAEIDSYDRRTFRDDAEANAVADRTFGATLKHMVGVPARTPDDALAALDWLVREGADLESDYYSDEAGDRSLHGRVVTSLVDAVRGYIEWQRAL